MVEPLLRDDAKAEVTATGAAMAPPRRVPISPLVPIWSFVLLELPLSHLGGCRWQRWLQVGTTIRSDGSCERRAKISDDLAIGWNDCNPRTAAE
ncbi:unnamed protein product [Pseudo-nitzschia multistriata]|uniref:Uncharacterized protein n=1 Tax=Pseudo-nitzschia multistriata TaxID=183589 RepID=A0A448ZBP5_9STRA|nr:unnamed protein product [Pseudo-nitzschia multistriata]